MMTVEAFSSPEIGTSEELVKSRTLKFPCEVDCFQWNDGPEEFGLTEWTPLSLVVVHRSLDGVLVIGGKESGHGRRTGTHFLFCYVRFFVLLCFLCFLCFLYSLSLLCKLIVCYSLQYNNQIFTTATSSYTLFLDLSLAIPKCHRADVRVLT